MDDPLTLKRRVSMDDPLTLMSNAVRQACRVACQGVS
jgi:hypothetical protein